MCFMGPNYSNVAQVTGLSHVEQQISQINSLINSQTIEIMQFQTEFGGYTGSKFRWIFY